ncbi:hypothetical protein QFC21_003276 [Naganishia friedmannii]|uniref:Uncharacterized protein n=1 Tax=Naganishia friedmannii TaxID=89922 RepID=A0ACC2VPN0_9TREE|nr:hypothetical protein QFC21_003276 [Naganishia friedmannii]
MRYTTTLVSTLALLASFVCPIAAQAAAQQPVSVDCTDSSTFQGFVNALLTVLHYSNNIAFEKVIAEWSETEAGYEVLESVWSAVSQQENWTLLVPTDAAITSAGLTTPYTNNADLYSILTYHILPLALPSYNAFNASAHYIAESIAPVTPASDIGTDLVLQKGKTQGQISVVALKGESTITGEIGKGDQAGALGGLKLMSVDTASRAQYKLSLFFIMLIAPLVSASLPEVLSTLAKATTDGTTSSSGLSLYTTALNNTKVLNTLTNLNISNTKGLTIFAPADVAFSGDQASTSAGAWLKVLAGHYTSSQTLYSTGFTSSAKIFMSSANSVTFVTNSSGTYVVSSDASKSSAKIIRSDILLQGGGVMHIVDRLLASTVLENSNNNSTTAAGGGSSSNPATGGTLASSATPRAYKSGNSIVVVAACVVMAAIGFSV